MSFKRQLAAVLLLTGVLLSCSRQKTLNRDEFDSQLRAAVSLCAETRLFVGNLRQNKSTQSFASGHVHYLQELASDDLREANKVVVPNQFQSQFQVYRDQLEELSRQLTILQNSSAKPDTLSDIDSSLQTIQGAFEHLRSGL
jgi:hypothetical protein